MDKVLVKNGARHNIELVFDDLQEYVRTGVIRILNNFIDSYGIAAELTVSGIVEPTDTTLKVTYNTPGVVNVAAGSGLTSELHLFNIVTQNVALPSGTDPHTNTLYLKYAGVNSAYTAVLNGFKYAAGTNLAPTRLTDSYEFIWDQNPGIAVSGLILADVTISGAVVLNIDDRRDENILIFANGALAGNTLFQDLVVAKHLQNTDTGTTATAFYVDTAGQNLRVLTEFDTLGESITPLSIKDLRLSTGVDLVVNRDSSVQLDTSG